MSEFSERVGIVVGGARGVGRATADALAAAGCHVAIVDDGSQIDGSGSDPAVATQAAEEIAQRGVKTLALPLDIAQPDAAERAIAATRDALGPIDYAIYGAGFHHERALLRGSEAELARVLDVHLIGAMRFVRAAARAQIEARRPGSIVLCSASAGFFGSAGQSLLAAAAGGLVGFVRTAATELRRHDVRINVLIPTARTRLTAHLPLFSSIRPDSLTPEHAAQVVLHLLSDGARDVHGEVIGVAGGRIYAFRHLETSGAFLEGPPPSLEEIGTAWRDVTRR